MVIGLPLSWCRQSSRYSTSSMSPLLFPGETSWASGRTLGSGCETCSMVSCRKSSRSLLRNSSSTSSGLLSVLSSTERTSRNIETRSILPKAINAAIRSDGFASSLRLSFIKPENTCRRMATASRCIAFSCSVRSISTLCLILSCFISLDAETLTVDDLPPAL